MLITVIAYKPDSILSITPHQAGEPIYRHYPSDHAVNTFFAEQDAIIYAANYMVYQTKPGEAAYKIQFIAIADADTRDGETEKTLHRAAVKMAQDYIAEKTQHQASQT